MITTSLGLFLFAVTGAVVNQTTSQPQPGATVTLYRIGNAGPEALTSVKSAAGGKFEIPDTPAGGPHLLQTAFGGITYNKMLPPGRPTTDLTVDVFNASAKADAARVVTHMILLEPNGMKLQVNESVIWRNEGKTAYYDEKNGTMCFFLPAASAAGKVRVNCTAPQGMPIERPAVKTTREGIYTVDFPVKPGETRFDILYELPMTGPGVFTTKNVHGGQVRLVAPSGVTLDSDKIKLLGKEPSTQAGVYEVTASEASIGVSGTGSLRRAEGESGAGGGEDEDGGEGLKPIPPRIYGGFKELLALFGIALVAALVLLYRKSGNIQA